MLPRFFRFPAGRVEQGFRMLHSESMRMLGRRPHLVCAQGARFVVDTTDLIDRSLALYGDWEGEQVESMAQVCHRTDADWFLDIGANSGVYSILLAMTGSARWFVAFEPDPGNRARLVANLAANRLSGIVQVVPCAVGSEAREVELMEAGSHNRGESWIVHPDKPPEEAPGVATHRVRQIRFDDEFAISGQTLVIKMDVEGSEFHALDGMRRTLAENACYLQVELYSERFEDLKALFAGLGYRYLKTVHIDHYFTNIPGIE